jgi:hypothetical protein
MGVIPIGSARWIAREAELAARGPTCAVDALSHALVSADDSLVRARSLVTDRLEATRWVHAADRDLGSVPADSVSTDLLESITGTRAAITRSLQAPDVCFDHAIDAARGALAHTAAAGGRSLEDARVGAKACVHPPRDWTMLGDDAPRATATRTALDDGSLAMDPGVVETLERESHRATLPDTAPAITAEHLAAARVARDELARAFDPLVHDLIEHARQLRDLPTERIRRTPYELVTGPPPRRMVALHLEGSLPAPDEGPVRVAALIKERRPESGNGTQVELPVGDYGMPFAIAQAKAAQALNAIVVHALSHDSQQVGRLRGPLLEAWTFQRSNAAGALQEGVTSIAQATAVLTQRRIPAMDEFELLDRLAESHAYDRLAKAPITIIGPIARTGWRFEEPLVFDAAGRARVGGDLDELYRAVAKAREVEFSPNKTTRAGCPVALRGHELALADGTVVTYERTLLTELSREYLELVKRYLRAEPDATVSALQ